VTSSKRAVYLALIFSITFLGSSTPSIAEPYTFVFHGTVDFVFDGLGEVGETVSPGATFMGSYTFESATPNTAEPVDEGEAGVYHHDAPPAGVRLQVSGLAFGSDPAELDFEIIVNDEVGLAGVDEYGFVSRTNAMPGWNPNTLVDLLEIDWLASTAENDVFGNAALPLIPPDLARLGGGLFRIYGECTRCLGPAAFFIIEGTLTSLEAGPVLNVGRDGLSWTRVAANTPADLLAGDLEDLRIGRGDFSWATRLCLASNLADSFLAYVDDPLPGEGSWFLLRASHHDRGGTYDSGGTGQSELRDWGIAASGADCE